MASTRIVNYLIVGEITRDYVLLPDRRANIDFASGSLLYSAGGFGLWETSAGLVARMGCDEAKSVIERFPEREFDCRGILPTMPSMDIRRFYAYDDLQTVSHDDPITHFGRLGIHFPKSLLGYSYRDHPIDHRTLPTENTIRLSDIPEEYFDVTAAHLCPLDFLSHALIPSALRQNHVNTITIDPGEGYMHPSFWDQLPVIISGITAILTSEEKARTLFQARSADIWDMAEAIAEMGCEFVVIKRGVKGYCLYSKHDQQRWTIPAYPVQIVCPHAANDAFNGGFLAGYRMTYDPVRAALHGSVSASFAMESADPLFCLSSLPGLPQARLEGLSRLVTSN